MKLFGGDMNYGERKMKVKNNIGLDRSTIGIYYIIKGVLKEATTFVERV